MADFRVSIITGVVAAIVVGALYFSSVYADADKDKLTDTQEKRFGTDPTKWDTDGDDYCDSVEIREGSDPLDKNSGPKSCGGGPGYCTKIRR